MEFKEQYKHPLWQKRRLEALDKAQFVCSCCGDTESQLHVHHRQYFNGRMIWEYSDAELEVLCDSCHGETHARLDDLKTIISMTPVRDINAIVSMIAGYLGDDSGPAYRNDPHHWEAGRIASIVVELNIHDVQSIAENAKAMRSHSEGNAATFMAAMPGSDK